MSRPRWFKNINDLLRAAKAHGLVVEHAGKHWQVKENLAGLGRNRIVAVLPTTGPVHTSLMKDQVSRIKRETGKDIRRDPPRKQPEPPAAMPMPPIPEMVVRAAEPEPKPEQPDAPPKASAYSRSEIKQLVREAIVEAIIELARKLAPSPEPKPASVVPARTAAVAVPKPPPPPPAPAPTPKPEATQIRTRKRRAPNLTEIQASEIVGLYEAGEDIGEIARTYGIAMSTVTYTVSRHGGKLRRPQKGKL